MTELQRYLAEEVAEDHVDGIITRREAIRRLGLLGRRRDGGDGDAGRRGDGARDRAATGTATVTGTAATGARRPGRRSPRSRSRSPAPRAR